MNLPLFPGSVDTVAEGFIGAEEEENLQCLNSKIKLQKSQIFLLKNNQTLTFGSS